MQIKKHLRLLSLLSLSLLLIWTQSCKKEDDTPTPEPTPTANPTVTDIDGNVYHTVTIGTQTWMVENLKVTHARNGDAIAHITNFTDWQNTSSAAWCNYNNDGNMGDAYGRLYNWYAVAEGSVICPEGWHIPSRAEWQKMIDYLGGVDVAGCKLREIGTAHWISAGTGVTNETGFTALPGGVRNNDGTFLFTGIVAFWWSTTESSASNAYNYQTLGDASIDFNTLDKSHGMSVRCVKD